VFNGKNGSVIEQFLKMVKAYEPGVSCSLEEYVAVWNGLLTALRLTDDDVVRYIDRNW